MERPSAVRALLRPIVLVSVIVAIVVWAFSAALHDPQPKGLAVGLVAPDAVSSRIESALDAKSPGSFAVARYSTEDSAREAIKERSIVGAFVADPAAPRILLASGAGAVAAGAVRGAFGAVASALGVTPVVEDLYPLPTSDPRGIVPFFLVVGVVVSGILYGSMSSMGGAAFPVSLRLLALVAFAIVDGAAAALAAGSVLGFGSEFWLLGAVCAGIALAVASAAAALYRLVGVRGIALAALIVMVLGNASSGGPIGADLLPDAFRAFTLLLPPGAGVLGVRSTLYFQGAGLAVPATVLAAWFVVSAAVLVLEATLRSAPARRLEAAAGD